jgi:hypothetical protein
MKMRIVDNMCKYLNVIEYVLCGGSDDDGGDCGVFVLLLAEHNDLPSSDLPNFDSKEIFKR